MISWVLGFSRCCTLRRRQYSGSELTPALLIPCVDQCFEPRLWLNAELMEPLAWATFALSKKAAFFSYVRTYRIRESATRATRFVCQLKPTHSYGTPNPNNAEHLLLFSDDLRMRRFEDAGVPLPLPAPQQATQAIPRRGSGQRSLHRGPWHVRAPTPLPLSLQKIVLKDLYGTVWQRSG